MTREPRHGTKQLLNVDWPKSWIFKGFRIVVRVNTTVRVLRMAAGSGSVNLTIRVLEVTTANVSIPPVTFVKAVRLMRWSLDLVDWKLAFQVSASAYLSLPFRTIVKPPAKCQRIFFLAFFRELLGIIRVI